MLHTTQQLKYTLSGISMLGHKAQCQYYCSKCKGSVETSQNKLTKRVCSHCLRTRLTARNQQNIATAVTVISDFCSNRYYLHLRSCNFTCTVAGFYITVADTYLTVTSRYFCYTVADTPYYQQICLSHSSRYLLSSADTTDTHLLSYTSSHLFTKLMGYYRGKISMH